MAEIVEQISGISEMQPFANQLADGTAVWVRGLGDGIAHILKAHATAKQERETAEAESVEQAA